MDRHRKFAADVPYSLRRGLVAYWPLASKGAVDLKSHLYTPRGPYDLTNNGSVVRGSGPSNNLPDAIVPVRATPSYLSVNNSAFNPGSRPFGISVWAWRSTDATDGFSSPFSKYAAAGHRSWVLERVTSTSRWVFNASSDGTNVTTTSSADTKTADTGTQAWAFVTAWWDRVNLYCQVNMGTPATAAFSGPVFVSDADVQIGSSTAALRWDGRIAQAIYWSRVPTQAELRFLYNSGKGRDLTRYL